MEQNDNKAAGTPSVQEMEFPEELKAKARLFFTKGAETAYTLNYDYAIELYLDGLMFWPDALEEGHKPLRDIALRRHAAGGKKSGFGDSSKHKKPSEKSAKAQMLKAEYLLSKDPSNIGHMTEMLKAAVEGDFRQTVLWIADLLFELNRQKDKPSPATFVLLRDSYIKIEVYSRAFQACQQALLLKPKDSDLEQSLRDLSTEVTMQQGKYDGDGDFRDSIQDRQKQEELQSQELLISSKESKADAITQAQQEYQDNPVVSAKIFNYVDALCKTEMDENENKAIEILEKAYADSPQFRYKQRSGEIRIKQLNRQLRHLQQSLKQDVENAQLKAQVQQVSSAVLAAERDHYRLCVDNYPTDLRYKYEYARRLMRAKEYDDAIPQFQEARSDPRHRTASLNCIGQCFYYKQWYTDAIETFEQGLKYLENPEDAMGKELRYNLGRAYEADSNIDEALNCFRKVAQIDFNYRDVRTRVDALRKQQRDG